MTPIPGTLARRTFLKRMGHLGIAGTAAPWAINLAAMGEAAAFNGAGGYKALVCIFLYGGNDNGNTVIPFDSASHAEYITARGGASGLGIARDRLVGLGATGLPSGRQYALSPWLSPLTRMFNEKKLAVQLNVGPLIKATTLDDYRNRRMLPPKLFSHNDQQSVWQSSNAEGSIKGWGGNLGDLALGSNGSALFTCISVTGNAVFLSGDTALAYQIGTGGAVRINPAANASSMFGSETCRNALNQLITQGRTNLLENELNTIVGRSIGAEATLGNALAGSSTQFDALLPDSVTETVDGQSVTRSRSLNRQLKMVARLIAARTQLGLQRQVFLVSLGGFDTHDNLSTNHRTLLTQVGEAMDGFQKAMEGLQVSQNVTTFTASDFGRTITSNGDGSDHGWGSHHFVMGGAVKGGAFYGQAPGSSLNSSVDLGQGRLIPTTSVDQYAGTMARWFGVDTSDPSLAELKQIAPNIGNFGVDSLPGFLA